MNKALLDTDIFSEVNKGVDPVVARNAAAYRAVFGRYAISTVTLMEAVRGYRRKQGDRQVRAFLNSIRSEEILPFDEAAAELAGRIIGELEAIGRPIGVTDPMIAAIAIARGLELVTGNTAHFREIQRLGYPLTLGNWRS